MLSVNTAKHPTEIFLWGVGYLGIFLCSFSVGVDKSDIGG